MTAIKMVMFDLAGTTIQDHHAVADSLFQAATESGLVISREEVLRHMGTNKLEFYRSLSWRAGGSTRGDGEREERALAALHRFEELMLEYYRHHAREIPGATDTFRWCREHGIRVATDTGFHRRISSAIMEGMGWLRDGLVDIAVDVEHVPHQRGRPAPYMIFHAMSHLGVQSVQEVIKVGDTAVDMLEGVNAGCRGVVCVLTGPCPAVDWGSRHHTHVIPSVKELPQLIEAEFIQRQ